tara:strand:+ start:2097 stop:2843 length:747 start_codon:yes stop_codon:yes gene_type:complete
VTKLKPYTILKDKHEGETCFIIGAGTSALTFDNAALALQAEIFKHVVISVNSGILLCPWGQPHPNPKVKSEVCHGDREKRYWLSNDALCRRWSWWNYVKACNATKIVRDSWKEYYAEIPDFLYFWIRPTSEDVINPKDLGLSYCSSVPSSIDLAIQMGCKKIFIIGLDQYMIGETSHFWHYWPKKYQPTRIDRVMALHSQQKEAFEFNNLAFPALKEFADSRDVTIFNCNPKSKVDVFSKIKFEDSLS